MAIIDKPSDYFNTVLWSGDNVDGRAITTGLETNWTWAKRRNATNGFIIADSVRGATYKLDSSTTGAQVNNYDGGHLESFTSTGFTMGVGSGDFGHLNASGGTYVAWNWKAGTSFTNDASGTGIGTIDSTGSFNNDSGFSIVSYTGTGSAGTIKHGLSSKPSMIIFKNLSAGRSWMVYHQSLGATKFLYLDATDVVGTNSGFYNDTEPTSSVFSVGTANNTNYNGETIVAYCFADSPMIKCGSYVGNGNANGTFVNTSSIGTPAFVMVKNTNVVNHFAIYDNKRNGFNTENNYLRADGSYAEGSETWGDFELFSNGFKPKATDAMINSSGNTFIYMAISASPFQTSSGVPATAR